MKRSLTVLTAGSFLLLFSCTGAPPAREQARWLEQQAAAQARLERGAPEDLQAAAALLDPSSVHPRYQPQAQETAALASRLFHLLFPELALQSGAPAAPAYQGPYAGALDLAEQGRPSRDALRTAPAAAGGDWLARILPYLYLHHLPVDAGRPGARTAEVAAAPGAGSGAAEPPAGEPPAAADRALAAIGAQWSGSAVPPYLRGVLAEHSGSLALAADRFQESLQRAASFYPARLRLASLQLHQGEAAAAAENLQTVRRVLPRDPAVRRRLAVAALALNDHALALSLSAELQDEEPHNQDYLLLRCRALAASGEWRQALKPLDLALASQPERLDALLLKARILAENGHEPEEALRLLQEAQDRHPSDPRLPELAGEVLLAAGQEARAVHRLQSALVLEPGRVSALRLLLQHAVARKSWLEAALYLSRILEREQSESDLALAYRIHESLGDTERALAFAERLQALQRSGAYTADYAAALLAAGHVEEARRVAEENLGAADPPAASRLLYVIAAAEPDPARGIGFLQQALVRDPDNLPALLLLSRLYAEAQDLRKARLYLKRAAELDPENAELRQRLLGLEESAGLNY